MIIRRTATAVVLLVVEQPAIVPDPALAATLAWPNS
jgi:hypothetical protein